MLLGILDVVILCMLLMMNGLFAMSELAIISSRKVRLQQRAEEGDQKARAALDLAGNPQRFLATAQIGITLIGVLSGAFGEARLSRHLAPHIAAVPYVAQYSDTISLVIVVSLVTFFSLLSELIPKRVAIARPEGIARAVARPMEAISRIAAPAIHLLSVSTELLLRLGRFRPAKDQAVTEEEIRALIDQATIAGVFHEAEQEMVERVFRLGDRRVGVMMTPRRKIVWLDVNDSPDKILRKMAKSTLSRFPVTSGRPGNVLGVVHVRDLAVRSFAGRPFDLRAALKKPIYVHESMHALKVLELFRESGMEMAIVVDEYGAIEGLVTLSDIMEAIVGDIFSTEHIEEPRIVQREDGSWLLDGMLPVDELKDHLHIRVLPEEKESGFRSLGGFLMTSLKRIPSTGDRFECCGYAFEVVDMDGRRVDKVLVMKKEEPPETPADDTKDGDFQ